MRPWKEFKRENKFYIKRDSALTDFIKTEGYATECFFILTTSKTVFNLITDNVDYCFFIYSIMTQDLKTWRRADANSHKVPAISNIYSISVKSTF